MDGAGSGEGPAPVKKKRRKKVARKIRVRKMSPQGHIQCVLTEEKALSEATRAILAGLLVYVEPQTKLVTTIPALKRVIHHTETMLIIHPVSGG